MVIVLGLYQLGHFGMLHEDKHDCAASLSVMRNCSRLPPGYESGRFHLASLGIFVVLEECPQVYFSGRFVHGGTPPLAPPNAVEVDPAAYRAVVILYPLQDVLAGGKVAMWSAGGKPYCLRSEAFFPE